LDMEATPVHGTGPGDAYDAPSYPDYGEEVYYEDDGQSDGYSLHAIMQAILSDDGDAFAIQSALRPELLGLGETESASYLNWPTVEEILAHTGLAEGEVREALGAITRAWGEIGPVADFSDIVEQTLRDNGGAMAADDVVAVLTGEDDPQTVAAIVRAAVEVEQTAPHPLYCEWRPDERIILALSKPLAEYAGHLGNAADEGVRKSGVMGRLAAMGLLRRVRVPEGTKPLGDHDLLGIAASCSHQAALSSEGELYRRGLPEKTLVDWCGNILRVLPEDPNRRNAFLKARFPEALGS